MVNSHATLRNSPALYRAGALRRDRRLANPKPVAKKQAKKKRMP